MHTPASRTLAPRTSTVTYPGGIQHVQAVRADLRPLLRDCPMADEVVLCASELAANAALHSRSRLPGGTFTVVSHKTFGRFERGNDADDWHWFSRDRAGHGGIVFKKFVADQKGLTWVADLDDAGSVVEAKHKGDVGRFISWAEFSITFIASGTPGIGG
jgi:hypothetical protein